MRTLVKTWLTRHQDLAAALAIVSVALLASVLALLVVVEFLRLTGLVGEGLR